MENLNPPVRMKATIAVFLFLVDDQDRIYLQRRHNTRYMDGHYEPPAGKVDEGEFPQDAVCREASEEAGIKVERDDVDLFHTYMNLTDNNPWLGLMFRTRHWQGAPTIQETDKCDDAGFYSLDALPPVMPQVRDAIAHLLVGPSITIENYSTIHSTMPNP